MLDELDVVADRAHAAAVERVEQFRVALPAPGPAAFALAAVVLDRAVVDLDHRYPARRQRLARAQADHGVEDRILGRGQVARVAPVPAQPRQRGDREQRIRSEEHTSELQSLMRTSYAVFCLKKKKKPKT